MSHNVYHFKPRGMKGSSLIPLNCLKEVHPEVYSEHVKKYEGREQLLEKRVPLLDCLWNDVLHISPINPQIILDLWKKENLVPHSHGVITRSIEVYKIPIEFLDEKLTVCFQPFNFDHGHFDPALEKIWNFKHADFSEQKEVSPEQLIIWKNDISAGRRMFWYSHTMHVLTKQQIDISACELISSHPQRTILQKT
jgi:hypothetical protein